MNNEEPITRLKSCKFCKTCTPTKMSQVGAQKMYLIISCECTHCTFTVNIFLSPENWESLKNGQIEIPY